MAAGDFPPPNDEILDLKQVAFLLFPEVVQLVSALDHASQSAVRDDYLYHVGAVNVSRDASCFCRSYPVGTQLVELYDQSFVRFIVIDLMYRFLPKDLHSKVLI